MRIGLVAVLVLVLGAAGQGFAGAKKRVEPEVVDRSGFYTGVGAGLFTINIKGPGFKEDFSAFGGYGAIGYALNENIAIEGRIGASGEDTKSDIVSVGFVPVPFTLEASAEHFFTALIRASTSDLGGGVRVFGLLGGSSVKARERIKVVGVTIVDDSDTDTSLTFGGGVEKEITEHASVAIEYVRYYQDNSKGIESALDAITASGRLRF